MLSNWNHCLCWHKKKKMSTISFFSFIHFFFACVYSLNTSITNCCWKLSTIVTGNYSYFGFKSHAHNWKWTRKVQQQFRIDAINSPHTWITANEEKWFDILLIQPHEWKSNTLRLQFTKSRQQSRQQSPPESSIQSRLKPCSMFQIDKSSVYSIEKRKIMQSIRVSFSTPSLLRWCTILRSNVTM